MAQVSVRTSESLSPPQDTRRPSTAKAKAKTPKPKPAPEPVVVEEWTNARATAQAQRAANARQASGRRRFVDPTTCERDYTMEEIEFMAAMQQYKKESGRLFPTCSEILEVLTLRLGYRKLAASEVEEECNSRSRPAPAAARR